MRDGRGRNLAVRKPGERRRRAAEPGIAQGGSGNLRLEHADGAREAVPLATTCANGPRVARRKAQE
jgi:hypothetical protein